MLNVHQVRLRFIFARALYLTVSLQKAYGSFFESALLQIYGAWLRIGN